jgi:benzoyl-CoA reductase/2-hydroxyglutaryl-CoA dehydratase subunit BcrC/BadD/HgdB
MSIGWTTDSQYLRDWKGNGRKVIGYFCSSFPKEVIYAAGILPFRILGSTEPISEGNNFLTPFACYLARSSVDLALQGKLSFLDGAVTTYSCDVMGFLSHRWSQIKQLPEGYFIHFLTRPLNLVDGSREIFLGEINSFKESLERHFQVKITDGALAGAIRLYNKNRELLREIDRLRQEGLVTGVEAAAAGFSSMVSPPEESNDSLTEFLAGARQRPTQNNGRRPRLFVSGSWLPNEELFEMIESAGVAVAADDLCVGCKYFWGSIDENSPDPLNAIASYYLAEDKLECQCASMSTENRVQARLQNILNKVKDLQLKGVIFANPRFCDLQLWDYKVIKKSLEESGIRTLQISVEGSLKTDQVRNRLEAFLEIIS